MILFFFFQLCCVVLWFFFWNVIVKVIHLRIGEEDGLVSDTRVMVIMFHHFLFWIWAVKCFRFEFVVFFPLFFSCRCRETQKKDNSISEYIRNQHLCAILKIFIIFVCLFFLLFLFNCKMVVRYCYLIIIIVCWLRFIMLVTILIEN